MSRMWKPVPKMIASTSADDPSAPSTRLPSTARTAVA